GGAAADRSMSAAVARFVRGAGGSGIFLARTGSLGLLASDLTGSLGRRSSGTAGPLAAFFASAAGDRAGVGAAAGAGGDAATWPAGACRKALMKSVQLG